MLTHINNKSNKKLINTVNDALSIIHKSTLTSDESDDLMKNVILYWKKHVNEGFLNYRKSVSNEQTYAALDWMDPFPGSAWFIDHTGKRYLDLLGGYGIYNVGRCHPVVTHTVQTQLKKQALHSQELLDPLRSYCAHILSLISPYDNLRKLTKCFFTNSGTESVEACLKLAFLATNRNRILSTINAFHGKTIGSLACTSKEKFRGVFSNVLCNALHIPYNDETSLRKAFESAETTGDRFACFIVEPIQGEGGIYIATESYLKLARELCDHYQTILIFDEVQSGMGRTGKWWACQHSNVCPDLMAIGKAFGGGVMPAGACIGTDKVWQKYIENPFLLTTTFGGNPLALSAAIATIKVLIDEDIIEKSVIKGELFLSLLSNIKNKYPKILKDVRGRGLMIGIEFMTNEMGITFSKMMFENNVLVAGTLINAQTIRIEPPLTITNDEIFYAVEICEKIIKHIYLNYDDKNIINQTYLTKTKLIRSKL